MSQSGQIAILFGLASAFFVFSNAISLSLVSEGQIIGPHLIGPIIWLIAYFVVIWLLNRFKTHFDPYVLSVLMLLSGWSILMVDRLANNFLSRQISWVVLGTAVILPIIFLPHNLRWLRQFRYTLLFLGLVLLATTFFFGVNPSGATTANYWLQLPFTIPVFFQPSELLKLLLVIFLASFFDEQALLNRQNNILILLAPISIMGGFCLLLLLWQQDLGAATLFFLLFLSLFYIATGRKTYLLAGFILLMVAGSLAYFWFDVVALRIDAWISPWPDADGRAFQIVQSLYAFGSGGILGQGIGQGFPDYIPVVHSDFVFAAIGEEWGLIGSLTIVFCFTLLMHRGILIALKAKRPFHRYLATGITILLSTQAILIMGGVSKLLPLTGVTLPFVSYGGSSMLVSHVMIGLLLYLSSLPQNGPRTAVPIDKSHKYLLQLHIALLVTFSMVAISLLYWSFIQAGNILIRDDNPRRVESALRIQRGTIVDRNGMVLAETVGTGNNLLRIYPLPEIGPAVGYYSFKHGTAGVENGFNQLLSQPESTNLSRFWAETMLHQSTVGQNIKLTLDATLQLQAHHLMKSHTGGLILFEYVEEENQANILSMVSVPTHNPNLLDEQFDQLIADETAPLLNRTTQGLYQPGMILQPFVLATAVNQSKGLLNKPLIEANSSVQVDGQTLRCQYDSFDLTSWEGVVQARCPQPMIQLGEQLETVGIEQTYTDFGLTLPISLPLNIETSGNLKTTVSPINSPALAAIGQDALTITPMSLGRAWIMLMTNGRLPQIQLVSHIQTPEEPWQAQLSNQLPDPQPIKSETMLAIQTLLPNTDDGIVGFSGTAVSGQDIWNSWYMGTISVEETPYFVVIVLEENKIADPVEKIGRDLLLFIGETLANSN